MNPMISVANEPQARALVPELSEILSDSIAGGASVGFMADAGAAEIERYWHGIVDRVATGDVLLLVARLEGRLVGTAQLHLIGKANQPHRAEVAKVLVHASARRRGVGAALMGEIETLARLHGRDLLVLDTDADSEARRLYGRLGWTEVGTIPRYALMPDGADCAATFFYRDLRAAAGG